MEHLVHAREAYICDGCVAEAQQAIASAPAGHRRLRIKPRPGRPHDRDAAELAIEQAFETVSSDAPDAERCAAIERGANLGATMEEARERLPARGGHIDASVEYVRFLGEDEAEVHFAVLGGLVPRFPDTGHAVLDGGTWKVSRDTWCRAVGRIGVQCPPPG